LSQPAKVLLSSAKANGSAYMAIFPVKREMDADARPPALRAAM